MKIKAVLVWLLVLDLIDAYGLSPSGAANTNKNISSQPQGKRSNPVPKPQQQGSSTNIDSSQKKSANNVNQTNKNPTQTANTNVAKTALNDSGVTATKKQPADTNAVDIRGKLELELQELRNMKSKLIAKPASSKNAASIRRILSHIEEQINKRVAAVLKIDSESNFIQETLSRLASFDSEPLLNSAAKIAKPNNQHLTRDTVLEPKPSLNPPASGQSVNMSQFIVPDSHRFQKQPALIPPFQAAGQSLPHVLVPVQSLASGGPWSQQIGNPQRFVFVSSANGGVIPNQLLTSSGVSNSGQLLPSSAQRAKKPSRKRVVTTTPIPAASTQRMTTEPTTPANVEVLEQKYLESTLKKQQLEITKLKLEIRALRREERMNMPEVENEDLPPQGRGADPGGSMSSTPPR